MRWSNALFICCNMFFKLLFPVVLIIHNTAIQYVAYAKAQRPKLQPIAYGISGNKANNNIGKPQVAHIAQGVLAGVYTGKPVKDKGYRRYKPIMPAVDEQQRKNAAGTQRYQKIGSQPP